MALPPALTAAQLAARLRLSGTLAMDPDVGTRLLGLQDVARELVGKAAPKAPPAVAVEAVVRIVGYLYDQPSASEGMGFANAFTYSGARAMLRNWLTRRALPLVAVPEADSEAETDAAARFAVRFGFSASDRFTADSFAAVGDIVSGVDTPERAGPVWVAFWLPDDPPKHWVEVLRTGVGMQTSLRPAFSGSMSGPHPLTVGGVEGRFWRSRTALNHWSGGNVRPIL